MTPDADPERSSAPSVRDDLPPSMNLWISWTLRVGVVISAVMALIGLAALLAGPAGVFAASTVHGSPFSGAEFLTGLAHGRAVDILFLACIVLIVTPLIRVVISIGLFARVHDRPFVLLTVTVLLLLAISVLIGAVA